MSEARTPASLRRRLLVQLALPLLVLFIADGALSFWAARGYADRVYDRWLVDSAQTLAQQVRLAGGQAEFHLPRVAQEMFEFDIEDVVLYRVEGANQRVIGGRDVPRTGRKESRHGGVRFYEADVDGATMRFVELTSPLPPVSEEWKVMVGETTRKRDRVAEEILLYVWVPQIVLLLLAGGFAYRVIVMHTEKVHALSVSLRDMSARKLSPVAADDMPAEMMPLIEALNALIAKLDAAALAHRTFIANAAHQLRTPLTAMQLQAEQAMHCGSVEEMREAISRLQDVVHRAGRLANQLLLLSRAEPEAQSGANRSLTDLYELAFETARAWVPAAMAAQIDLGFDEGSAHAVVEIDEALVAEAINNLLDNALKYCPPRTRVTVSVRLTPEPTVIVEDTGRGIPREERSRVVQRFYRGDHARSGGTGLGLAIANEIALAHAGEFSITDAPGGGARFEMRLPSA
ncbi:MAG: sensor histidine kinase [Burkholderiales bacterium]